MANENVNHHMLQLLDTKLRASGEVGEQFIGFDPLFTSDPLRQGRKAETARKERNAMKQQRNKMARQKASQAAMEDLYSRQIRAATLSTDNPLFTRQPGIMSAPPSSRKPGQVFDDKVFSPQYKHIVGIDTSLVDPEPLQWYINKYPDASQ